MVIYTNMLRHTLHNTVIHYVNVLKLQTVPKMHVGIANRKDPDQTASFRTSIIILNCSFIFSDLGLSLHVYLAIQ